MKYKVGEVAYGKVFEIQNDYIIVKTLNQWTFKIYLSDISDWKNIDLKKVFNVGEIINFIIKSVNPSKKGIGNFKANHPNFLRSPFNHEILETAGHFDRLKKHSLNEIGFYEYKNIKIKNNK